MRSFCINIIVRLTIFVNIKFQKLSHFKNERKTKKNEENNVKSPKIGELLQQFLKDFLRNL